MASKNINVLLSLVDRFTSKLKAPADATSKFSKNVKLASNGISNFGAGANARLLSITNSIGRMTAGLAGIGAFFSVGSIVGYANKAIASAEKEVQVQAKLGAILQNVQSIRDRGPEAWKDAQKSLNNYAGSLGKVGVDGKGVILNGMQQLATFQLNEEQISVLSDGMADLLAQQKGLNATGEDAVGIANMIGKAMSGNASALSRVGITMSESEAEIIKNGTAMERANTIAKVLANNVGGVNKALADTPAGKMKKAEMAYAGMMKNLGMMLLPLKAKFIGVFADLVPMVAQKMQGIFERVAGIMAGLVDWFAKNGDALANAVMIGLDAAVTAFKLFGDAIAFIGRNSDIVIPIITGLAGAFTAFNVITKVVAGITAFKAAAGGLQVGLVALKTVLMANPIVLWAAAIGLVIAALVALYMHWDDVKAAVLSFWDACTQTFNSVLNNCTAFINGVVTGVSNAFNSVVNFIGECVDSIIAFFVGIGMAINTAFTAIVNTVTNFIAMIVAAVVGLSQNIYSGFIAIVQYIANAFAAGIELAINFFENLLSIAIGGVVNFLSSFDGVVEGISEIFNGIIDFVTGVFTGNWNQALSGIVQIFTGYFDTLSNIASNVLNYIGNKVSNIGSTINSLNPFGGGNSEKHNATGSAYWQGGSTYVNESNRGELMVLPSGTSILAADKTEQLVNNYGGGVTVNLTVQGNVIGNEAFMNQCGAFIVNKLKESMNNM